MLTPKRVRSGTALLIAAVIAAVAGTALWAQGPVDLVGRRFQARVVTILDGDTVDVVLSDGRRERVRLHGVDTPERDEPYSNVARTFTRILMFSRQVQVTGRDVDTYGRLVARIVVDGRDASEALLAAGLACTYRRYAFEDVLEAAVDRARAEHLGFWAEGAPQPACVAREAAFEGESEDVAGGFNGNVNSRVYHAPWCLNFDCPNCTRHFTTREAAEAAGFRPAGDCLDARGETRPRDR